MTMTAPVSKAGVWTGRILTGLVGLFLIFDGLMKVVQERHVVAASAELGLPMKTVVWIGALLLVCTVLYLIPRTAILGAILLTGYLGGAVATNVMVKHPAFECLFPVIFGVLAWGGVYFRDGRVRALIPLRG